LKNISIYERNIEALQIINPELAQAIELCPDNPSVRLIKNANGNHNILFNVKGRQEAAHLSPSPKAEAR
jgi:hypothetical protein